MSPVADEYLAAFVDSPPPLPGGVVAPWLILLLYHGDGGLVIRGTGGLDPLCCGWLPLVHIGDSLHHSTLLVVALGGVSVLGLGVHILD